MDENDDLRQRLVRVEEKQDHIREILTRVEQRIDGDVTTMEQDFDRLTRQHHTLWNVYRAGKWLIVVSASAGFLGMLASVP